MIIGGLRPAFPAPPTGVVYTTNSSGATTHYIHGGAYVTSVSNNVTEFLTYTDTQWSNSVNILYRKTALDPYVALDEVNIEVFRRSAGSLDSWVSVYQEYGYQSTNINCNFGLYDYLFVLTLGAPE